MLVSSIFVLTGCLGDSPPAPHLVYTPNIPSGPSSVNVGQSVSFSASGSGCSRGHEIQYRFDWGDGSYSSWSYYSSANKSWSNAGTYYVLAQARCSSDTTVTSEWSSALAVTVTAAAATVHYRVTVKQITDEFEANEYAADTKYKNKTVAVTGYVTNISIGYADKPVVWLQVHPDDRAWDPAVLCFFDKTGTHPGLAELRKGDHVTIVGEFWFYSSAVSVVYLDRSRIE